MARLSGKTAVVTGGASGIGNAIATGFAQEGATVWIADINGEAAQSAASRIGGSARSVTVDVSSVPSIDSAVEEIAKNSDGIDILVNAAGVYRVEPWLEVTEEGFDWIMGINARGMLFMTQAIARKMVEKGRGGTVVNIASGAGRKGDPVTVVYSASKAFVISLTQSTARAFAEHGIRANAIAPGPVETPMWKDVTADRGARLGQTADAVVQAMRQNVPLGRVSSPEEQVGAAIFLASDESSYVTGQTLNVDGGLFMN